MKNKALIAVGAICLIALVTLFAYFSHKEHTRSKVLRYDGCRTLEGASPQLKGEYWIVPTICNDPSGEGGRLINLEMDSFHYDLLKEVSEDTVSLGAQIRVKDLKVIGVEVVE